MRVLVALVVVLVVGCGASGPEPTDGFGPALAQLFPQALAAVSKSDAAAAAKIAAKLNELEAGLHERTRELVAAVEADVGKLQTTMSALEDAVNAKDVEIARLQHKMDLQAPNANDTKVCQLVAAAQQRRSEASKELVASLNNLLAHLQALSSATNSVVGDVKTYVYSVRTEVETLAGQDKNATALSDCTPVTKEDAAAAKLLSSEIDHVQTLRSDLNNELKFKQARLDTLRAQQSQLDHHLHQQLSSVANIRAMLAPLLKAA